jgi:hypothetical protein
MECGESADREVDLSSTAKRECFRRLLGGHFELSHGHCRERVSPLFVQAVGLLSVVLACGWLKPTVLLGLVEQSFDFLTNQTVCTLRQAGMESALRFGLVEYI